jgi:hypothetical protein
MTINRTKLVAAGKINDSGREYFLCLSGLANNSLDRTQPGRAIMCYVALLHRSARYRYPPLPIILPNTSPNFLISSTVL